MEEISISEEIQIDLKIPLAGLYSRITKLFFSVAAVLVCVMPIPVFADVVMRTVFDFSLPGIVELEEYFLLLVIYYSLAYAHITVGHIHIDLVTEKIPASLRPALTSVTLLLSVVLFVLMTWQLAANGIDKLKLGVLSSSLRLPFGIFYLLAAMGTTLEIFAAIKDLIRFLLKYIAKKRLAWVVTGFILAGVVFFAPFSGQMAKWSPDAMGIAGMVLLFFLIFAGMPIGFAMGIAGFLGLVLVYNDSLPALRNLGLNAYAQGTNYFFTVGPLFIMMGQLAFHSGISQDLFETASKWLGRLRGGVAISAVAGCAGFSAVCGDSLATAITMGTISLPEMRKRNYSMRLGTGCLAAGGTLGILIPPSVGFIFYAIVTEVSVGQLFIAGIVPGLLLTTLFIVTIWIGAKIYPEMAPPGQSSTLKEKLVSLKGVLGMLFLFVLILGGILGGFFSPVEGGSIGCVGAFALAVARRRLTWRLLVKSAYDTVEITAKLFIILIGVGVMGFFLAATRLPMIIANFAIGLQVSPYIIMGAILLMFILMGCVLNVIPMIMLVLPTIFPTVTAMGFDPVWFGVICVICMEMGQITPPIGVNVFAICSVAQDVPMQETFKGIVPFFLCMVLIVVLLLIFPPLATYLPGLLY
jgi:tripartite ATP-independent transporter DctM subunit